MGQTQSAAPRPKRSHEQLVKELANRFAEKCFSSLELYSLKDNFKGLAEHEQGLRYLKEDTVARFLAIPDVLGASPVVFQMISYLGAFPFLADAPAVLGLEQLVIVVTLLTDRYRRVLARGAADRRTLLFRSLAVHDRKLFADVSPSPEGDKGGASPDAKASVDSKAENEEAEEADTGKGESSQDKATSASSNMPETGNTTVAPAGSSSNLGFAVDQPAGDDDEEAGDDFGEEDDELVLAALEALDYANPAPSSDKQSKAKTTSSVLKGARIPADNFLKMIMLLVLVAPLGPQQQLSQFADRVHGEALDELRAVAECILATFLDVETSLGIKFLHFDAIIPVCFPFLFNGFNSLFEHFLFSKNLDLSKKLPRSATEKGPGEEDQAAGQAPLLQRRATVVADTKPHAAHAAAPPPPPLFSEADTILNLSLLSQLSFFLPGSSLFHRLRLLYSGDNDGFSMGSFETKVFNWRAPTILLVQGSRVGDVPHGGQETAFAAALPPRRFPHGNPPPANGSNHDETLIFGAYVSQPWKLTNRECFGDSDVVLFQLSPVHDVFGASSLNHDYAAFVKPSAANNHTGGIAFGSPPPTATAAKGGLAKHQSMHGRSGSISGVSGNNGGLMPLGPLSLLLDSSFEFGVLNHDCGSHNGGGGGAFHSSVARPFSFQDRFSIEAVEVWGCGGDAEAKVQAERWAWEAREAEARRRINLGTGDIEADRALLEMAGLIGGNRSGGSMA